MGAWQHLAHVEWASVASSKAHIQQGTSLEPWELVVWSVGWVDQAQQPLTEHVKTAHNDVAVLTWFRRLRCGPAGVW